MKQKAFEAERDRCQRYFSDWVPKLGLAWWQVEVNYYDKRKIFRKNKKADTIAAMRIWCDWRYMDMQIAVCTPVTRQMDAEELERTVVHELCHALVNEMRESGIDHEERVVTTLTKAFMWVRDLTRDKAKS